MTSKIHQPNDKLFKAAMADLAVAKDFFKTNLPSAILEKLDFNTLKLQKETFIDEAYKDTEADVIYSAKINGLSAYFYLLCEQQTKVDPWLAFRILGYILRIMELHRKQHPNEPLPLVYPMIIYVGDKPWDAPLDIFHLFGEAEELARTILFKPCQLLDVKRTSDDELQQQTLFGLVAFAMKHRKTKDFERVLKRLFPWISQVEIVHNNHVSRLVLRYITDQSSEGNKDLLLQEGRRFLSQTLQGEIMTIAQQWEQEGIEKGIQEGMQKGLTIGVHKGRQEGRQEAMEELALRLLQRGMPINEITTLTDLSERAIQALQAEQTTH